MLFLNHQPGAAAIPGDLTVGPGDGTTIVGVFTLKDDQFNPATLLNLGKNTMFNLNGHAQTLGGIYPWDRPCQILIDDCQTGAPGSLTVATPDSSLHFSKLTWDWPDGQPASPFGRPGKLIWGDGK